VSFDQRLYDGFMEMCRASGRPSNVPVPSDRARPSGRTSRTDGAGGTYGAAGTDRSGGTDPSGRADDAAGTDRSGGTDGAGPGRPKTEERHRGETWGRYRPTMVVHADLGFLTGSHPNGIGEMAGVGPISTEVARRLACDAKVVFSLERTDGSILDQKRARRSPTMAQRIEIDRRDKGCRFASCGFVDFTEVHHIVHWVRGGETNLSNLITLCGRHHRAVHELGWTMEGNADELVIFEGPHGHRMTSSPSPTWRNPVSAPMRR
jgi:hypothetical protein